jgi:hypothetical protein
MYGLIYLLQAIPLMMPASDGRPLEAIEPSAGPPRQMIEARQSVPGGFAIVMNAPLAPIAKIPAPATLRLGSTTRLPILSAGREHSHARP